ncbi:MAG: DNA recombination protein RmuC [Chlamydiales bacterium]
MNLILFLLGCLIGFLLSRFLGKKEGENKEKMALLFKGISADALRQNHETFFDLAKATFEKYQVQAKGEIEKKSEVVETLVKPIKESLENVDKKIQELEKSRVGAYSALKSQVDILIDSQRALRSETTNLVKALRAPSVRGRWGEMQLKRVVEMAGMVNHCDFFEQANTTTEGARFRPDMIVKLPGNKQIIVDAKAPLQAYLEAIEASSEEEKMAKLKEHALSIRNHVTLLSRKTYWEQFDSTPEFVILFLPGETFFSAALEQDPSLIEVGVEKRVILATPTTLIALLRSVAYGWNQENISQKARQVSLLGKELYKRLSDMATHWTKVGKNLDSAVQSYNKAIGSLESRVFVVARKFNEMEVGEKDELLVIEPIEQTARQIQVDELQK